LDLFFGAEIPLPAQRRWTCSRRAVALLAFVVALLTPFAAGAQRKTLYLDRLTMAGAPDDGFAVWRPYTSARTRLFAQMGLGLTFSPLLLRTISGDNNPALQNYTKSPVSHQVIDYATVGAELGGRVTFIANFPVILYQSGSDPSPANVRGVGTLQSPVLMDARLDVRGLLYQADDKKWLLAGGMSFYVPSGARFSYGGDGSTHTSLNMSTETVLRDLILVVNGGLHFRPKGVIGNLAVGNELTLAVGAFWPMRDGRIRVGGSMMFSTGLEGFVDSNRVATSTFMSARNSPLEWLAEGRMALDATGQLWAGGGFGTRLDTGYGAPDVRMLAVIGYHATIQDSEAPAPERRMRAIRERIQREGGDADHDGIPDDVDLCPSVPEDKLEPDATDGCPKPADRDNDGLPDTEDKCPDTPEDKDGIQDMDGCPEDDYDQDGIPDVTDACPREPGTSSPDPKTNGCPTFIRRVEGSTEIQILKQIQFDTGKASIKATSFSILDEIVRLLRANPDIGNLSIEGHTDNRGAVDMNEQLSQTRAESVMKYLVDHGIAEGRLEAHGYGPSRPIAPNETEGGRQQNRRVEFHIQ
jgi:outer membrane protein OmpA-like peptidoglycan-associated protein